MVKVAACGCDCADCLAEPQDHRCLCEALESHDSPRSEDNEEPDSDDLEAVVDDLESDSSYVPHSSPEYEEEELCPFHAQCVEAANQVEEFLLQRMEPRDGTDEDERIRELVEHICAFYQ